MVITKVTVVGELPRDRCLAEECKTREGARLSYITEVENWDHSGVLDNYRPNFIFHLCCWSHVVSRHLITNTADSMPLKTREQEQPCGTCQWVYIIVGNNLSNYNTLSLTSVTLIPILGRARPFCKRAFECVGPTPGGYERVYGIVRAEQILDRFLYLRK